MRPDLLAPQAPLTAEMLGDVLLLVGEELPEDAVTWSPLELAVVYDWAMRKHLRASDNPVRLRPRPCGLMGGH